MIEEWKCQEGRHIGINNTTGKCPLCGEQLERPQPYIGINFVESGKSPKCLFDQFKPSDGPLGLVCSCEKCSIR